MPLLFAAAFLIRLFYVLGLSDSPLTATLIGDGREYDAWAQRIAGGEWLGADVFYQAPLYPYLLGVVYSTIGRDLLIVRILQAVCGATACVLLARAGERFFDRSVGLAAGCVMAVYAPAVFFDGLIQKSSLDLLLTAVVLYGLAEWSVHRRWQVAAALGAACGLLALNRENARVLIPVVVIWLLIRREFRGAVVFVVALLAVLLPIGVRNYAVGGEFLVSTSQAGPNFYIGNHRAASGLYEALVPEHGDVKHEREDATRLAQSAVGHPLSPGEVSSYWAAKALDDIRGEPGAWAQLMIKKLMLSVNAVEVPDTESLSAYAEHSSILRGLAWINFGILLPLACCGMWFERARWRQLAVLYALMLALLGSIVLFFVFARYRFPLVAPLSLFAAVPIARLVSRSWPSRADWLPGLALAGIAGVGAWWPIDVGPEQTYLNVGSQLTSDGRAEAAVPLLKASVQRNPLDPLDVFSLGVAFDRSGDKLNALHSYRRAVELNPRNGHYQGSLALALMENGLPDQAVQHFALSVDASPTDDSLRTNYGVALLQSGNPEEARSQLQEAVRLDPASVAARNAYGSALQQSGHLDEAIKNFQVAVDLDAANARSRANLGLAVALAGRTTDAANHLERAVTLDPSLLEAELALADIYVTQGRRSEAAGALRRAIGVAEAKGRQEIAATLRVALAQLDDRRP